VGSRVTCRPDPGKDGRFPSLKGEPDGFFRQSAMFVLLRCVGSCCVKTLRVAGSHLWGLARCELDLAMILGGTSFRSCSIALHSGRGRGQEENVGGVSEGLNAGTPGVYPRQVRGCRQPRGCGWGMGGAMFLSPSLRWPLHSGVLQQLIRTEPILPGEQDAR